MPETQPSLEPPDNGGTTTATADDGADIPRLGDALAQLNAEESLALLLDLSRRCIDAGEKRDA